MCSSDLKAKQLGTVITEGTTVKAFEEKPANPKSTLVSTGCYVLPKEKLNVLVEYAKDHPDNIGGIFEHFLSKEIEIDCASFFEPWFDIGSFEAYLDATKELVGEHTQMGEDASQETSALMGSNVIGAESHVKQSKFRNVVLFEKCKVEDCALENCIIDNGCMLKGVDLTGKMLREGTKLVR